MKLIKKLLTKIRYIFDRIETERRKLIDAGYLDFGGQGRDKYGR